MTLMCRTTLMITRTREVVVYSRQLCGVKAGVRLKWHLPASAGSLSCQRVKQRSGKDAKLAGVGACDEYDAS